MMTLTAPYEIIVVASAVAHVNQKGAVKLGICRSPPVEQRPNRGDDNGNDQEAKHLDVVVGGISAAIGKNLDLRVKYAPTHQPNDDVP